MENEIKLAIGKIKKKVLTDSKIALILGSGLGDFADTFEGAVKIPTIEIPNYPQSTVEGHKGFLIFGKHKGIPVVAVQGRTHSYEGYPLKKTTFSIAIMKELGIEKLLVTNAAGSTNRNIVPGDLMLITDQVNFLFNSPLQGHGDFTDMSNPYSKEINSKIEALAIQLGISLKKGVLWVSSGPTYETAAEVRMIQRFGGDAASMSTAPEVILSNTLKIETVGISCITNFATGISSEKLTHKDVTVAANMVKEKFSSLVSAIITKIFGSV